MHRRKNARRKKVGRKSADEKLSDENLLDEKMSWNPEHVVRHAALAAAPLIWIRCRNSSRPLAKCVVAYATD